MLTKKVFWAKISDQAKYREVSSSEQEPWTYKPHNIKNVRNK